MISYHPAPADPKTPYLYAKGFRESEIDSPDWLAEMICKHVWSPILWRDGIRKRDNFLSCTYLSLDFDDGRMSLAAAQNWAMIRNLAYVIGLTKSHQKEKKAASGKISPPCDRFRFILVYEKPLTDKNLYEFNMKEAMKIFPCDESCKDAARFYFPCTDIYAVGYGSSLKVKNIPDDYLDEDAFFKKSIEISQRHRENQTLPGWIRSALSVGCAEGSRHKMCYRLGIHLFLLGYDLESIVKLILTSPLKDIGAADVRRAAANGIERITAKIQQDQTIAQG